MKACYDLSRYPCNFNFVEFLVAAATFGATHITLNDAVIKGKYAKYETERRLKSIVEPACTLAGCTFDYGYSGGIDPGYHISAVLKAYQETGGIKKLHTVKPAAGNDYTVTIRNSDRYPQRNSGKYWRRFAEEIGAVVIEDYGDAPIHMHDRMALYAGARMNYFVANGPMVLCFFSDYPFTAFMKNVDRDYHARHGFHVGTQLPWCGKNQRLIWGDDSYERLIEEHTRNLAP